MTSSATDPNHIPSLSDFDPTATGPGGEKYSEALRALQLRLLRQQGVLRDRAPFPVVIVFEGADAAGKGGAIRRLTGRLDPRGYRVVPVGAPNPIEEAHHYLRRFHLMMPARGGITIFDRSWYGRVLVERVEGFATPEEWNRAYAEIRDFERTYADAGTVMLKFWLQVTKEEQLKRFRAREEDPFKEYKITDEDWRNRERWDEYQQAADEMLRRTHQPHAPWLVISSEDKNHARLAVLQAVVDRLDEAFNA